MAPVKPDLNVTDSICVMAAISKNSDLYDPYKIPPTASGMRIGLFGGSFNPPHLGHLNVSEMALRRLNLNQVWWMVTPGNPLKHHGKLLPLEERIKLCKNLNSDPNVRITAFEKTYNTRFTADSLRLLKTRHPDVNFAWIMGADNLAQFHQWERWQEIATNFPIAVIDRPGSTMALHSAKFAQAMKKFRIDEADSKLLVTHQPPVWSFLHGPRSSLSSTQLRKIANTSL